MIDWIQLREDIAKIEHNIWMRWAQTILMLESVSPKRVKRWKAFFIPYKNLAEKEKNKDRKQADKIITRIKKYVTI